MNKTKTKINTVLSEEEGSSMVEFAIVLPVLIVLTIGSIYLSVGFTQKSIMNGLAFMETRAASVRQQHTKIAEHAVKNYMKSTDGQQLWLEEAESDISVDIQTNDLKVIVTKDAMNTEVLSNALNIIGGRKPDGKAEIRKVKSAMILPIEYIDKAKGSDRPNTRTTVNYETAPVGGDFLAKNLLDKLPQSVSELIVPKSLVDPKDDDTLGGGVNDSKRADRILGSDSTYNMERANEVYKYWGLDNFGTSEKPNSRSIAKVNTLGFLDITAENVALIEGGANLAQIAAKFATFGPIVQTALKPIQSVGAAVLPTVESVGTKFADMAETNNNRIFKKSLVGIDP